MKEIGIVGLGRMGLGIGERLKDRGWEVFGYDKDETALSRAEDRGLEVFENLEFLCGEFSGRKLLWIMVPADRVDDVLGEVKGFLAEGDTVIDGGNSYYEDSVRRFEELKSIGVDFLDVGVSGGVWGKEEGYCLMVGGRREVFEDIETLFSDLSWKGRGYAFLGGPGAGHFAKMVHNGIEYGMMQAIGEGFELLKESPYDYDLMEVARLFTEGSVIRSWLMELTHRAFADFGDLKDLEPVVQDSGEGRWALHTAVRLGVPVWVMADALFSRFRSRQSASFRDKLIAALRYEFGGHKVKRKGE